MAVPTECAMRARITFAVIGTLVGLSILICFGVVYYNWDAALWGMGSGIFAAFTLLIHVQFKRGVLGSWFPALRGIMLTGCFVQLAGVCGFVAYLVLAISQKQALTPYGAGYYVTCVWCFMTWKWGFLLFHYTRSYRRLLDPKAYQSMDEVPKV